MVVLSLLTSIIFCNREVIYQTAGTILSSDNFEKHLVVPKVHSGFTITGSLRLCGLIVIITEDRSIFLINTTAFSVKSASAIFEERFESLIFQRALG
jgi:hypothetical protein